VLGEQQQVDDCGYVDKVAEVDQVEHLQPKAADIAGTMPDKCSCIQINLKQ
jgi:hypothetical protein